MSLPKFGTIVFLTLLFLLGILHWLLFYNFSNLSYTALDWPKEFSYYSIIRSALIQHFIPYHISASFQETNRFFALPETPLSPQVLLLPLVGVGRFIMANTLFLYSLGFLGCLLIRRGFRLSILPFLIFYLIFNFNGYITSHIAVGHSMWNGYFLLPFFLYLISELIKIKKSFTNIIIKFSFLLFAIMLQGAFHIFVWCLFFLVLLALFNKILIKPVFLIIAFSVLLCFCRLLPAALTFYNKGYPFLFISGYPDIRYFFSALVALKNPGFHPFRLNMGWWEFDAYITIIGLVLIAYFGIILRFKSKNWKFQELDMPILIMLILSLGQLYSPLSKFSIFFLNSQRFSSRFIIIPVLVLLLISIIRLQELLPRVKEKILFKLLAPACVALMAVLLARHSYLWRISAIEQNFKNSAIPPCLNIFVPGDTFYINSLKFSAIVSLITIIALTCFYLRRRFSKVY